MSGPEERPDAFDFEGVLAELEEIAGKLDREDIGLDDAIVLFERGIAQLAAANRWLDQAAGQVEELIETATGRLETRPLDSAGDVSD